MSKSINQAAAEMLDWRLKMHETMGVVWGHRRPEIGSLCLAMCLGLKMTQKEAAERLGCSVSTVSGIIQQITEIHSTKYHRDNPARLP